MRRSSFGIWRSCWRRGGDGERDRLLAVAVRLLPHGEGLPLPAYQSAGAAGADLFAALPPTKNSSSSPARAISSRPALRCNCREDLRRKCRPRSGLALQHGVTVLNAPGTIDSDYRGEIGVLLSISASEPFEIVRGARIAQLVVAPVTRAIFVDERELDETARGAGGFGSTGTHAFREKTA